MKLRLGTRGSLLARTQSGLYADALKAAVPGLAIETVIIRTSGDEIVDVPLAEVGGKGLFVKEIEQALIEERIDLAVHSLKDLPAEIPDALMLGAVSVREDPRDALISRVGASFDGLPQGARIGTSSVRRSAQLGSQRPDLQFVPLRGNVDTRLRKLREGQIDAIVLATAGLVRLGMQGEITELLPPEVCLPAIGQGVLAIEVRRDDREAQKTVALLHDPATSRAVSAERAFLHRLGGDCVTPLCAYALPSEARLWVRGFVADRTGGRSLRDELTAQAGDDETAAAVGRTLAERLLAAGAGELLARN